VLDCLVIGGGPAGLTAAVNLARYRRSVALYEGGHSRTAMLKVDEHQRTTIAGIYAAADRSSGTKIRDRSKLEPSDHF
jgi:thioredoxin reductase